LGGGGKKKLGVPGGGAKKKYWGKRGQEASTTIRTEGTEVTREQKKF